MIAKAMIAVAAGCLLTTVLGGATGADATSLPQLATATQVAATVDNVVFGAACPDVVVIAARGSNEAPQGTAWNKASSYTGDHANHGAGATLGGQSGLYGELVRERPDLKISLDPVVYPADSVSLLLHHPSLYVQDAGLGASNIVADIKYTDSLCGGTVRYVLAGYSLGAWAVHDALHDLSAAQLREVAGVSLFGDPKFVPIQSIVRDYKLDDFLFGIAAVTVDRGDNGVPPAVTARTGSWCFPDDPVCQALLTSKRWLSEAALCASPVPALQAQCGHFQYPGKETGKAAAFLVPFLPKTTRFPHLTLTAPPGGTVGTPYEWTASAAPPGSYTWTSAGTLPPGLAFSMAGVLSGTPAQAGTFTVKITATGAYGRDAVAEVSISISPASSGSQPGAWIAAEAPLPANAAADPFASLYAVACPSAATCVAAGSYADSAEHQQGLLLAQAGTSWMAVEAPLPANAAADAEPSLNAVACSSASACVATGYYTDSAGAQEGLLVTGSGSSWTATESPLPPNADTLFAANISAVACAALSGCAAVGVYTDPSGNPHGLLVTGSGTSWTATEAPLPADATSEADPSLNAVTCPSASTCVAGGYYSDSGASYGWLLTGSGTSWTATKAPLPGNAGIGSTGLNSVSCSSPSACTATGYYRDLSGVYQAMLVTGSGTSWAVIEGPRPAGTNTTDESIPLSLACPSESTCVSAGNYQDPSTSVYDDQVLLVTGSGNSWSAPGITLPADAATNSQTDLQAVACASASTCAAGGFYTDATNGQQGLLVTGSGGSWTATAAPVPADAAADPVAEVFAVACPSACVAVGSYDSSNGFQGLLLSGPG